MFTVAAATVASTWAGSPPSATTCRLSACWRVSSVKTVRRSLLSWRLTTTVKSSGLPTTRASRSPARTLLSPADASATATVSIFVPAADATDCSGGASDATGGVSPTVAEPPEMRCTSAM